MPEVPPAPPAPEGVGQVVLDTEGGAAEARIVTGHWAMVTRAGAVTGGGNLSERLCTTPCVASLPYGTHTLEFVGLADNERVGTAAVVFAQSPSVYRYALGLRRLHSGVRTLGTVAFSLGLSAALTGLLVGGVSQDGFGPGAIALSVGGLVGIGGAFALWFLYPPELQEGAGVQFAMPAGR